MSKERPIIMSAESIRAILAGRKTQTRRVMKPQPVSECKVDGYGTMEFYNLEVDWYNPTKVDRDGEEYPGDEVFGAYSTCGEWGLRCPYGAPGDRLWCKETWQAVHFNPEYAEGYATGYVDDWWHAERIPKDSQDGYWTAVYRSGEAAWEDHPDDRGFPWRPSIFMPRWASRLTLEVTGVRVERVQDISEEDAADEGAEPVLVPPDGGGAPHVEGFRDLWDEINAKRDPAYSWEANPYVWVVEFRKIDVAEVAA